MDMGVLPSRTPRIFSPLIECPFLHIPEMITTALTARGSPSRLSLRRSGTRRASMPSLGCTSRVLYGIDVRYRKTSAWSKTVKRRPPMSGRTGPPDGFLVGVRECLGIVDEWRKEVG